MQRLLKKVCLASTPPKHVKRRRLMVEPLDPRVVLSAAGLDPGMLQFDGQQSLWHDPNSMPRSMSFDAGALQHHDRLGNESEMLRFAPVMGQPRDSMSFDGRRAMPEFGDHHALGMPRPGDGLFAP